MNKPPTPANPRPRYQMIRELGRNQAGGRITYLAKDNKTQQYVVIKRFVFAQSGLERSGFKAYEREIQVLQGLDHPGIPHYLDSFESKAGFCLVQEYKKAQSLAVPRNFEPPQIKQIAISVLEIIIYLQNCNPSVIHRDIKPENILVDEQLNVYLVDFGLARIGSGKVAPSSVAAGTFGFMAPEQLYNRQLGEATDLYGLGATLICLLTETKSTVIDTLIDEYRQINFKHLLSNISLPFVNWLGKMVEPRIKDRFSNANAALEALKPIDVIRKPEVKFSPLVLEFKTKQPGEKLTQFITVSNPVPETILEGRWEVAYDKNDPHSSAKSHVWISFAPATFQGNGINCEITVDTSRLMANKTYSRQIVLHTNSSSETYALTLNVDTTLSGVPKLPYISIALLVGITWALTAFNAFSINWLITITTRFGSTVPWVLLGAGFMAGFFAGILLAAVGVRAIPIVKISLGAIGIVALIVLFLNGLFAVTITALLGVTGLMIGFLTGAVIKNHRNQGFSDTSAVAIALLFTGLSMSLSAGFSLGFNAFLTFIAFLKGLSLVAMILYPYLQREKLLSEYRELAKRRRLIKA